MLNKFLVYFVTLDDFSLSLLKDETFGFQIFRTMIEIFGISISTNRDTILFCCCCCCEDIVTIRTSLSQLEIWKQGDWKLSKYRRLLEWEAIVLASSVFHLFLFLFSLFSEYLYLLALTQNVLFPQICAVLNYYFATHL